MDAFLYRHDSSPGGLYPGNNEDFILQLILININKNSIHVHVFKMCGLLKYS